MNTILQDEPSRLLTRVNADDVITITSLIGWQAWGMYSWPAAEQRLYGQLVVPLCTADCTAEREQ